MSSAIVAKKDDGASESHSESPVVTITAERLIMNIINAIFMVFPKIGKKLSKQHACKLLTAMNVSGMLRTGREGRNINKDVDFRIAYTDYMIKYELDIRSIAQHIGIKQTAAVKFIRACFKTHKMDGLYPWIIANTIWPTYELLIAKFGQTIAQFIAESIIGEFGSKHISKRFPVFERISKNVANASDAKFFILEGCNYVASHDDQTAKRAPGQSERLYIDEFVNYLREMDEARYLKFQDEIAAMLSPIGDAFMPDCGRIIQHLSMERFDDDVALVRASFKEILTTPKPVQEPEPEPAPEAVLETIGSTEFKIPATAPCPAVPGGAAFGVSVMPPVGGPSPFPILPSFALPAQHPASAPTIFMAQPSMITRATSLVTLADYIALPVATSANHVGSKKLPVHRVLAGDGDNDDSDSDADPEAREGNYGDEA